MRRVLGGSDQMLRVPQIGVPLVLFTNRYEDIIHPLKDNSTNTCNIRQSVPKRNDYLATTVKMPKDLYNVASCRLTRSYLTSTHLQWHLGDTSLFEHARHKEHTDIGATVCSKSYRNQLLAK